MAGPVTRRRILQGAVAGTLAWMLPQPALTAAPFPIRLRKKLPYESLFEFIEPGHDEFAGEKTAAEITGHLDQLLKVRSLPLAPNFRGESPLPIQYKPVSDDVSLATFDAARLGLSEGRFSDGLEKWIESLGSVRDARFYVLPGERVRYEIASSS